MEFMMKSQKGVTLVALVIYIIVFTIVISILSVISSFFFSNVNFVKELEFHQSHGKLVTVSAYNAVQRFGVLDIDNDGNVRQFREKIQGDASPINIGYMICEPEFIDLIDGDDTVLEKTPMQKAAAMNEIMAYRHEGFWKCMDTVREKQQLEKLWSEGNAPWKTWEN